MPHSLESASQSISRDRKIPSIYSTAGFIIFFGWQIRKLRFVNLGQNRIDERHAIIVVAAMLGIPQLMKLDKHVSH